VSSFKLIDKVQGSIPQSPSSYEFASIKETLKGSNPGDIISYKGKVLIVNGRFMNGTFVEYDLGGVSALHNGKLVNSNAGGQVIGWTAECYECHSTKEVFKWHMEKSE
jgi:hypothetical protein